MSHRTRSLVGLVLLWAGLGPSLSAGSDDSLLLRDAETGAGLSGEVTYVALERVRIPVAADIERLLEDSADVQSRAVDGRVELAVEQPLAARFEVPGYRPLHTVLRPSGKIRTRTFWLNPQTANPLATDGPPTLLGTLRDSQDLSPVAGARVGVPEFGLEVRSGPEGRYRLALDPGLAAVATEQRFTLEILAPGYPVWQRTGLLPASGDQRLNVDLGKTPASTSRHPLLDQRLGHAVPVPPAKNLSPAPGQGDTPPASITVGFADAGCSEPCCNFACDHACTFDLEEYTRRGLPNEWIASWGQSALRAGSVAYRGFGAWRVANPLATEYDICSNACCQVNEPGTFGSTDAATAATAGLILMREGQVFMAEYSAQNNNRVGDLSCTNLDCDTASGDCVCDDGQAGSPSTGWPCLDDPPSEGEACFGHGRGMSQWGNRFWELEAEPRGWAWQLNHYYNDHGEGSGLRTASVSQVLVIDELRIAPEQALPGETVTIELDVRNLAATVHPAVMIGASFRQPPGSFIDDPDNDQPVVLPPGESTVQRDFALPLSIADGQYDLHVALFIDVDEDQAISSADLRQDLRIAPESLAVHNRIFRDRFE